MYLAFIRGLFLKTSKINILLLECVTRRQHDCFDHTYEMEFRSKFLIFDDGHTIGSEDHTNLYPYSAGASLSKKGLGVLTGRFDRESAPDNFSYFSLSPAADW